MEKQENEHYIQKTVLQQTILQTNKTGNPDSCLFVIIANKGNYRTVYQLRNKGVLSNGGSVY